MDFVDNYGKATIDEYSLSIHSIYNFHNPLFLYANIGAGKLKYTINRNIPLGIGANAERGNSKGMHYMGTIGAGYRFALKEHITFIPYLSGNYQTVSINPYKERGELRSTTMSFNIPKRESLATEIGATFEGKFKIKDNIPLIPSITLRYDYDFKDPLKKQIRARVSDMSREFSVPTYKVGRSSLYIDGALKSIINNNIAVGLNGGIKPIGNPDNG